MGSDIKNRQKFINYPEPRRGPDVPYQNKRKQNPALRGFILPVAAFLMEWVLFLPQYFWRNAGFDCLRKIREDIQTYESRFDPTVIPIEDPFDDSNVDRDHSGNGEGPTDPALWSRNSNPSARYYSVADYHSLYKSGELTPTAVAEAIIPLIRRDISPASEYSTAWFDCQVDRVLVAAEASTRRYRENRSLGLLDGVPTAVKDEYDLDGYRSCLGSLNDYTGEVTSEGSITSWCARKMEEAGAIILGKLSMHEFGLDTTGTNIHYGTPTNPHNPNYYTGGSSSGCAYAVSAGLVPVALGSDGGGSVRIPSSFCSIMGLKPTHGRLSHHPGVNHANTVSVNGPLAADIRSLSAIYHVAAMPHSSSAFPSPSPLCLSPSLGRPKVLGIPKAWFAQAAPRVQELCQSLLDRLVSVHGYTLIPIEIPFLVEGQAAHAITILTDAAALLPETSRFTAANRILLALGRATPATDYLLAQKLRQLLMRHLAYLWEKYPGMVIVTPTTGCAGWRIKSKSELIYGVSDGDQTLRAMEYVWLANFTGIPAITVPAGFAEGQSAEEGQ
ncbi:hypothetical protein MPDQ_002889, partial [Monascus purpureus]